MSEGQGAHLFFSTKTDISWSKIHRGNIQILKTLLRWVGEGDYADLIRPWAEMGVISGVHDSEPRTSDNGKLDAIAACWSDLTLSSDEKLVLDDTLESLQRVFKLVTAEKLEINPSILTLGWHALIPDAFGDLVEQRCPQALILVTVYCVLLKRVDDSWWIKGKAEDLLEAVRRELPEGQWDKWLEWSVDEVFGHNNCIEAG